MRLLRVSLFALLLLPLVTLTGCTLFPTKNPATLSTTTGAEQTERIFWQAAVKRDFSTVTNLISSQAVFTTRDGSVLNREQFLEHLKASPPMDYALGTVAVRPQGNDMVLTYSASVRETGANVTVGVTILSVWQQAKNSGWTLAARSETPASVVAR